MCGRFLLSAKPGEIADLFQVDVLGELEPRYNIAPSQPIGVIRFSAKGRREWVHMAWGLQPGWAQGDVARTKPINARAETAAHKPMFRAAMRHRRCLIPASGFYEWQKRPGAGKQPWVFTSSCGEVLAFAGLWECWQGPSGEQVDTAAIVTTEANGVVAPIHGRMPVLVNRADFALWLDRDVVNAQDLTHLLRPAQVDVLQAHPVSTAVNSPRNDGPQLIEPLEQPLGDVVLKRVAQGDLFDLA